MTHKEIISNLKGIFAPVVTPFDRQGEVDYERFRRNVQGYTGIGLAGVIVAGSSGEAPYLTERERLRLMELARRVIRPPELLIAGTGQESTRETIRLSRECISRGADALLVVTPNYFKPRMDAESLVAHYRALASSVSRPVLVYSIPQFTGLNPDPETIGKLSRIPNVVGLKESSGNIAFVRALLRKVRPGFHVLVGSVSIAYDALRAGAVGAVLSQANFVPDLCVGLYEAFLRGQGKLARELQQRLMPLAQKVAIPYGVAGIKAALDLCGYQGGLPRQPLRPLTSQQQRLVAAALQEARAGLEI